MYYFYGHKWNYIYVCNVNPYGNLNVKNAVVKSDYHVMGLHNVESSLNGNFKLNAEGRAENGGFIPLNYASSSSLNKYTFNPITAEI